MSAGWPNLIKLAARQHGVFTREQAARLGIDNRRIRTALSDGRVVGLSQQILLIAGHPRSVRSDAKAATLLSPSLIASHRTAAALFGFDGILSTRTDVTIPSGLRQRIPPSLDIIVHHAALLQRPDVVTVAGIPCTSKARTLADLGSVVHPDAVLTALIGAHRDGLSLRTLRNTAQRLHRPGQRGTKVLLEHLDAFERAGSVPESWFEEVLRRIIDHPTLPPLVSQYELHHRGRFVARFDHAFPSVKVAVEAHSKHFHFGPVREAADEERDLHAQRAGWVIVYLGWHITKRPAEIVGMLRDIVSARAETRGPA